MVKYSCQQEYHTAAASVVKSADGLHQVAALRAERRVEARSMQSHGAYQAGGVHVGRGDIEVEPVQVDGGVHEGLLRVPVRLRQERIPRAHLHGLGHLVPATCVAHSQPPK